MKETTKANNYRRKHAEFYQRVFRGHFIDIGAGDDPLVPRIPFKKLRKVTTFDVENGDANYIDRYLPGGSFDGAYASNCLEHMRRPKDALRRWTKLVKPGGWIVFTVPDAVLYEQGHWPSIFNGDHKATFGIIKPRTPRAYSVIDLIKAAKLKPYLIWLCDTKYDYRLHNVDQTIDPTGAECFIECVCKKAKL